MQDTSAWLNIAIVLVAVWFLYRMFGGVKGLRNLDGKTFEQELKSGGDKIVIDVREPYEYQTGFIPGAINIPLSQLSGSAKLQQLPSDHPIYLYCQSGMRSRQAARMLTARGFTNMAHLRGGIRAWRGTVRHS